MEFENISSKDISFSSMLDWEVYADDYKLEQEYITDDIGGLDGTVAAGKKTQGSIVFQVPENAGRIEVHYKHNFFNDNQVVFVVE